MKLGNKNKDKKNEEQKKETTQNHENDLEIIIGDDSELDISEVGDMMNYLRPKNHEKKDKVVIPKAKKKD